MLQLIDSCDDSNLKVYNLWATWCGPCVKEMPHFEALNQSNDQIDVVFLSLDDADKLETKIIPFLIRKNIQSPVKVIDETDFNTFIDKVHPDWSGALPATLVVNCRTGTKYFYEQEFSKEELSKTIHSINN